MLALLLALCLAQSLVKECACGATRTGISPVAVSRSKTRDPGLDWRQMRKSILARQKEDPGWWPASELSPAQWQRRKTRRRHGSRRKGPESNQSASQSWIYRLPTRASRVETRITRTNWKRRRPSSRSPTHPQLRPKPTSNVTATVPPTRSETIPESIARKSFPVTEALRTLRLDNDTQRPCKTMGCRILSYSVPTGLYYTLSRSGHKKYKESVYMTFSNASTSYTYRIHILHVSVKSMPAERATEFKYYTSTLDVMRRHDYKYWLYAHSAPETSWDPLENRDLLYWYDYQYGHAPYEKNWLCTYYLRNPTTPGVRVSIPKGVGTRFSSAKGVTGLLGNDYKYWLYPHSLPETSWNPEEHRQELYWYNKVFRHAPYRRDWLHSYYKNFTKIPIIRVTKIDANILTIFSKDPLTGINGVDYKYWLYPHSTPQTPWDPFLHKEHLVWYDKQYGHAPYKRDWLSSYFVHNPTTPMIRLSLHPILAYSFTVNGSTGQNGTDYYYWLFPHSFPQTSWIPKEHEIALVWYDEKFGHVPYKKDWFHSYLQFNVTTPIIRVTTVLEGMRSLFTSNPLTGAGGIDYKYWLYPQSSPRRQWNPEEHSEKLLWYDMRYGHAPYSKDWLNAYYKHNPTTPLFRVASNLSNATVFRHTTSTGILGFDYMYWLYPHSLPETSWNPFEHAEEIYWYDETYGHAPYNKDWLHRYFKSNGKIPIIRVTAIFPKILTIFTKNPLTGAAGVDYKYWLYPQTSPRSSWNPFLNQDKLLWYDKLYGHAPYRRDWTCSYYKHFPTTPIIRVSLHSSLATMFTYDNSSGPLGFNYRYWMYPHSLPETSWNPEEHVQKLYWYDNRYGHAPYMKDWLNRYFQYHPQTPIYRVTSIGPNILTIFTKMPLMGAAGIDYKYWLYVQISGKSTWNPLEHLKQLYWYDDRYGHAPYRKNWLSIYYAHNPTTPIIRVSLHASVAGNFTIKGNNTGPLGYDYQYWMYPHSLPQTSWNPVEHTDELYWYDEKYGHAPYKKDWLHSYFKNNLLTPFYRVTSIGADILTIFTDSPLTGANSVDYKYWLYPQTAPRTVWNPLENVRQLDWYDSKFGHAPYRKDWLSSYYKVFPTTPTYRVSWPSAINNFTKKVNATGPFGFDYMYWMYPHSLPETSWNPEEHKDKLYWYDNWFGHLPYQKDWLHSYFKNHLTTPIINVTKIVPMIVSLFTVKPLTGAGGVDYKYWLYPHSQEQSSWNPFNNKEVLYWYQNKYGHAPYKKDWIPSNAVVRVTFHEGLGTNFTLEKNTGILGYDYQYWMYPHSLPETSWNPEEHKVELYWYDAKYGYAPYRREWLHSYLGHNLVSPNIRVTSIGPAILTLFSKFPLTGVKGIDYKYWLYPQTSPRSPWDPFENRNKLYWYDNVYGRAPAKKDWISSYYKHHPTKPIIRVTIDNKTSPNFNRQNATGPLGYDYRYWMYPHSLPETSWDPLRHVDELYWYDEKYGHAPYRKDWLHSYFKNNRITPLYRVTSIGPNIQSIFTKSPLTGAKGVDYKYWLYPQSPPRMSWNPFDFKKQLYWYDQEYGHAPYSKDWLSTYYMREPTTPIIHVSLHSSVATNFTMTHIKGPLGYDYQYWMYPHSLPETSWNPEEHVDKLYWYDEKYGHAPYRKDWLHCYLKKHPITPIFHVTEMDPMIATLFTENPLTGANGVDYKYWLYPHSSPESIWNPFANQIKLYWYESVYGHAPYKKDWYSPVPVVKVSAGHTSFTQFHENNTGFFGYDYQYWMHPHSFPASSWNPLKHKKELNWYNSKYGHAPYRYDWLNTFYKHNLITPIFRVTSVPPEIVTLFTKHAVTGAAGVDYKYWLYPQTAPRSPWDPFENKELLYWYDDRYGHAPYRKDWRSSYYKHHPTIQIVHVTIFPSVATQFVYNTSSGPFGYEYMYWMYPHSLPETYWNPEENRRQLYWYDDKYGHAPYRKDWQFSYLKNRRVTPVFRVTSIGPEIRNISTTSPLTGADGNDYKYWLYPHSAPRSTWDPFRNRHKLYWYDKQYGRAPYSKDWLEKYYRWNMRLPIFRVTTLLPKIGARFTEDPATGVSGVDYKYWLYRQSAWNPLLHLKELYWYDERYGHAPYSRDWLSSFFRRNPTPPVVRVGSLPRGIDRMFTRDPYTGAGGVDYMYWLYPHTDPQTRWDPLRSENLEALQWYDAQYGRAPTGSGWLERVRTRTTSTVPLVRVSFLPAALATAYTRRASLGPRGVDYKYWLYPHSPPEHCWNPLQHKRELYWYDGRYGHAPYSQDWLERFALQHPRTPPPPLGRPASCYACGLREEGVPSDNCSRAFEPSAGPRSLRRFRRVCPHSRRVAGCFRRFLDVGRLYSERGCRAWPPAKGRSLASPRFARLERQLLALADGCVVSPSASLTPFARSVSLYARYHVCVCSRDFCNAAPPFCLAPALPLLRLLVYIYLALR